MRLTRATRHAPHQDVVAGTLSNACNALDSGRRDRRFSGLHSASSRRSLLRVRPVTHRVCPCYAPNLSPQDSTTVACKTKSGMRILPRRNGMPGLMA